MGERTQGAGSYFLKIYQKSKEKRSDKVEEKLYKKEEITALLINETVAKADIYVRKGYLSVLDQAQIVPLGKKEKEIIPASNMRLIKIDSFVFEKGQSVSQKLRNIYGAIEYHGVSAVLVLEGKTDKINIYLGVFGSHYETASTGFKTFLNSFHGTFPGCKYKNIKYDSANYILKEILPQEEEISITAISGMPEDVPDTKEIQAEKLDVLIDGMYGKPFSMILLAQYIKKQEIAAMRKGLESLYTQISPFQKQDISMSESETENYGINLSNTITQSMTISNGISYGKTETTGVGNSIQKNSDNSDLKQHQAVVQTLGAGLALIANSVLPESGNVLQSLFFGQGISNLLGNIEEVTGIAPTINTESVTTSEHTDTSVSSTEQESTSIADSTGQTTGYSTTQGSTYGKTMQRSYINKSVSNLLEQIERQIKLLHRLEYEGAFRTASYFIAGDLETACSAANLYRSIVSSSGRKAESSPIYQWQKREEVKQICEYLMRGIHPIFSFDGTTGFPNISIAQPIGLMDIPNYFCLPEKSVHGMDVTNHASFARNILSKISNDSSIQKQDIEIGCIYHMGSAQLHIPVSLCMEELTKHLFVTGATGVGKSNFCYQLISKVLENGIKVLVIEPAKGEYAKIFGGREDFHVYGTNMRYAPVLRVNPFAFPDGIHVMEHIDRLLDIFNAAWPMYSAMPAILKDAVEEIYIDKGFNMMLGDKPEDGEFPCFSDLLNKLPDVINRSAYSGEVKGNYIGALVTRVKSLTNGIYGAVFGKEELGDKQLFDENIIIDISRIGAEETKALLMGVLVMRLSEYRMCSQIMNSRLKHLTLLEEAHHLLRRQSKMSTAEGSDMKAASVEMITNAIAEMRTYGEGFIIADQSPGVVDLSVIRNTQTKVFFMLPDREDRKIAGDSISLSECQQQEIAKLPPGIAVIYQNQWSDPVLCKVNYFSKEKACPYIHQSENYYVCIKRCIGQCLAILLKNRLMSGKSSLDNTKLKNSWNDLKYLENEKAIAARKVMEQYVSGQSIPTQINKIAEDIERLIDLRKIFLHCSESLQIEEWAEKMSKEIQKVTELTKEEIQLLISIGIQIRMRKDPAYKKLYVRYLTFCMENNNNGIDKSER